MLYRRALVQQVRVFTATEVRLQYENKPILGVRSLKLVSSRIPPVNIPHETLNDIGRALDEESTGY